MGKIFRVGDLVMINKSYNPSQNYYCKIINIIDEFGKSHTSYDVITGYGDKNSKVKIDLLTLGIETDYVTEIEELKDKFIINGIDPHNIFLRNSYSSIEECKKEIESYNKNIEFFEKNKNIIDLREERIDKVLE